MWTSIIVQLTERLSQRCYQDNALDNTRAGEAEAVKDGSLGLYRQVSKSLGPYRQVSKSLGPYRQVSKSVGPYRQVSSSMCINHGKIFTSI